MDLVGFLEEREVVRHWHHRATSREQDIQEFVESFIRERDCLVRIDESSSAKRVMCRYVLVAQSVHNSSNGLEVRVFRTPLFSPSTVNSASNTSYADVPDIPQAIAAAVQHPVLGYTPLSEEYVRWSDALKPDIHNIVFTTVDEVKSIFADSSSIGFLVNIGPHYTEPDGPVLRDQTIRASVQKAIEMTSPVRSAALWPLKTMKKENPPTGPISDQVSTSDSPTKTRRRHRYLPLMQWPVQHNTTADVRNQTKIDREQRKRAVVEEVRSLAESTIDRRLFDFCSILRGSKREGSDMVDLKDTRSGIKDMIDFMDKSSLFTEAARQHQSASSMHSGR